MFSIVCTRPMADHRPMVRCCRAGKEAEKEKAKLEKEAEKVRVRQEKEAARKEKEVSTKQADSSTEQHHQIAISITITSHVCHILCYNKGMCAHIVILLTVPARCFQC